MNAALDYGLSIVGTAYGWWTSGEVPDDEPAWAYNAPPPDPEYVKARTCFCAGVGNLMRRAEGWEIPTLGNSLYDGGTVGWKGYFEAAGLLEAFDADYASENPLTVCLREFRDSRDQGHWAVSLEGGVILQSYDAGGGWPGVNTDHTVYQSHAGYFYEYMIRLENWLPTDDAATGSIDDEAYEYWKGECWEWLMAEGTVSAHLPGQEYDRSVDWTMQHWRHNKANGTIVHHPPTA